MPVWIPYDACGFYNIVTPSSYPRALPAIVVNKTFQIPVVDGPLPSYGRPSTSTSPVQNKQDVQNLNGYGITPSVPACQPSTSTSAPQKDDRIQRVNETGMLSSTLLGCKPSTSTVSTPNEILDDAVQNVNTSGEKATGIQSPARMATLGSGSTSPSKVRPRESSGSERSPSKKKSKLSTAMSCRSTNVEGKRILRGMSSSHSSSCPFPEFGLTRPDFAKEHPDLSACSDAQLRCVLKRVQASARLHYQLCYQVMTRRIDTQDAGNEGYTRKSLDAWIQTKIRLSAHQAPYLNAIHSKGPSSTAKGARRICFRNGTLMDLVSNLARLSEFQITELRLWLKDTPNPTDEMIELWARILGVENRLLRSYLRSLSRRPPNSATMQLEPLGRPAQMRVISRAPYALSSLQHGVRFSPWTSTSRLEGNVGDGALAYHTTSTNSSETNRSNVNPVNDDIDDAREATDGPYLAPDEFLPPSGLQSVQQPESSTSRLRAVFRPDFGATRKRACARG
ncbi:hypothetical protein CC1G_04688 [Coprinopsis cinerea okayama7|uniref:Uncharacterized protein n=1 Tax=Coprinopsis cinerea (strain Okayama-7 / 130 / ATCC MYA-4618 / FGSC 9003) TaxID=240176 RepID=A8N4Y8_COPC7|nr:hypothetical protein CC1G_04688 [Coprinopsis cinerea okayama7\|eukprot:XP_001829999.2 hypothetical protein CC1G_04688 [Coprinopsis cinerea okayama7\